MTQTPNRQDILERMQLVMGKMPDDSRRVPLDPKVVEEFHDDGIMRRRITFAVEPGDRCTAWLMIPESRLANESAPGPAMLCLHQTTKFGKDEPVGLGGKQNLHYALELTKRGYITLTPDYPTFGEYKIDCYAMGYASATMKGIWNHTCAVDLLSNMREVETDRIGCIGHSLGGHNALFLAAFDPRLHVIVSSCGFTRFTWNDNEGRGDYGNLTDWSHKGYMPRIAEVYGCRAANIPFDFTDVLSLIAPRPLFINAPLKDFFRHEGVRECVEFVAPIYARHNRSADLECHHPEGEHDFPSEVRGAAYRFIDQALHHTPLKRSFEAK